MAGFFRPRDKKGRFKKVPRSFWVPRLRSGGVDKPERHPVKPKVPGTLDQPQPPWMTTDPKIKRRRRRKI